MTFPVVPMTKELALLEVEDVTAGLKILKEGVLVISGLGNLLVDEPVDPKQRYMHHQATSQSLSLP